MATAHRARQALIAIFFGTCLTIVENHPAAGAVLPPPAPPCDETRQIVRDGVDWLIAGQKTSDLYAYERFTLEQADRNTQNMTRQIGTLWGMIRSLEVENRPEVRRSIDRARQAISAFVQTNHSHEGDVAFIEEMGIAKLNAAALYLLALTELKNKDIYLRRDEQRHLPMLATALRQMREDSGGFRYLFFMPKEENRITSYGSAEAVLALATYAEYQADAELKAYALDSFNRYYKSYLTATEGFDSTDLRGYFSWALQAQVLLHDDLEEAYHGPIGTLIEKALTYRKNNRTCAAAGCIVTPDLTDAPFLEGIMAALPIMRRYETDKALLADAESYASLALRQIADFQVTEDDEELLAASPRPHTDLLGGFCDSAACTYMRNDLAQHALVALTTYYGQACAT